MPERCPIGRGLYWMNRSEIPDFCIDNCEKIWVAGSLRVADDVDVFDESCTHDVEHEDEAIQRHGEGALRMYGILNTCQQDGTEVFTQEWIYTCPKD